MTSISATVEARFAAARTDSGLFKAGLWAEEVTALAYEAAAAGALSGDERAQARRFAADEREHAKVFETMLFALTVPVREHAGPADLQTMLPGLRRASRDAALERLEELEGAAIAAYQTLGRRLHARDALRSVATVMAGGAQHLVVIRAARGGEPMTRVFETGR